MAEESGKRKIESSEISNEVKRTKSTNNDEMKLSIINEITRSFDSRLQKLENRIEKLEEQLSSDGKKDNIERSKQSEDDEEEDNNDEDEEEDVDEDEDDNDIDESEDIDQDNINQVGSPTEPPSISKETSVPPALPPRATFGASSFVPKKSNDNVTSKPVFGATTAFGGASASFGKSVMDNMKYGQHVFDSLPSKLEASKLDEVEKKAEIKPETKTETSTTTSTFGSGFGSKSRFGNAFQESLKKKSFLDSSSEKKSSPSTAMDITTSDTTSAGGNNNKITSPKIQHVELTPVASSTGEEDEISHFNSTAKIFELDLTNIMEGWKERGVGPLHLNQSRSDQTKARLVMRSQGLLRVVLNYKINKNTELLKGLEASMAPGKYLRLNSLNADGKPIQYLIKFSNESLRDDLIEKVESLKSQM
ncbi:uncharacterized protein J8A68_000092 [[Candida] subhashii]|uniref:RanBD1 domain-containing protein n=1 Tax=[Candida] subhashii TaxID=561895 RepID=A0A8J5QTZ3_9ASCO|nr:uncharacterized protein J8A68_000092 [[Candida] subhashii]KAG7666371.1 hypothetical protein J8A68_000092 [[Candida] subhashii]